MKSVPSYFVLLSPYVGCHCHMIKFKARTREAFDVILFCLVSFIVWSS